MGGTQGFFASHGPTIMNSVVGLTGIGMSTYAAGRQARYMNQLVGMDKEQTAIVQGLDQYFLGGGRASRLATPGFREQFAEVDYSLQEQQRRIDAEAKRTQQQIADTMQPGGAKLRALADLAIKAQDAKSQAVRESQSKKRDLDVQLTNTYLQQAMGRKYGPSYDARLRAAQQDYTNQARNIEAITKGMGALTGAVWPQKTKAGQTDMQYTAPVPPAAPPVSPSQTLEDAGYKEKGYYDPYALEGTNYWKKGYYDPYGLGY